MVKRYDLAEDIYGNTIVGEDSSGEFVRHEDYEEVADKLEQAESDLKWFRDRITDIFQAM